MKEIAFGVLGGLALFIYGMNLMSDGLKKAAGERLRKILEKLTSNPIMGGTCRFICNGRNSEQQRHHGDGGRFRYRWLNDPNPSHRSHYGRKHRDHNNRPANCL